MGTGTTIMGMVMRMTIMAMTVTRMSRTRARQ